MKLAYVYLFPGKVLLGPGNKIAGQARAAREIGIDMEFLVLHDGEDYRDETIRYVGMPYAYRSGIPKKIEQTFFAYRFLQRSIDFDRYDGVILRYPRLHDFACRAFFNTHGRKIITEHHTNELAELMLSWRKDISILPRVFLESVNARSTLSRVAGLIGVTEEIRQRVSRIAGPRPSAMIPNGIDVRSIARTGFTPFDGRSLTIAFTVAESAPWQGIDRLLSGIRGYKGTTVINLILAGKISREIRDRAAAEIRPPATVHMPGVVSGPALDEVYAKATVAVSTLALYRKRMQEACPLKSREYFARGIPFVYAYDDPDIPSSYQFALKLENSNVPLDIERIIEFVGGLRDHGVVSAEMREFAAKHLDWRVKIHAMYNFAEKVFSTGKCMTGNPVTD